MSELDERMERIVSQVTGARSAVLVGLDGVVVAASDAGAELELVAAGYADLLRRASALGEEARVEPPAEISASGSSGTILTRVLSPEHALILVLEPGSFLGRARHHLRVACHRHLADVLD